MDEGQTEQMSEENKKSRPTKVEAPDSEQPLKQSQFASFLLAASSGIKFELQPNEDANTQDESQERQPFASLSEAGRYSKVILGRVISPGGAVLRDVAVKIQRDGYTHEHVQQAGGSSQDTNPKINSLWEREIESLRKFSGTSLGVVQILDLFENSESEETVPEQFKPVAFCHVQQAYFHLYCPQCGGHLEDCKDDEKLSALKVQILDTAEQDPVVLPYSSSTRRALFCAKCAEKGESDFFVRNLPERVDGEDVAGRVFDRFGLVRKFGEALSNGTFAAEKVPCVNCEFRSTCFENSENQNQDPPAFKAIHWLSFYEFYAIPLDCLHLQYDHAIQLVGGRSFDELKQKLSRSLGHTSGRRHLLSQASPTLKAGRKMIYTSANPEQFGLETLKVKLSLFRAVCEGLANIHNRCRGPHLDLKPQNIMVKASSSLHETPAFWSLDSRIIDLASANPYFHDSSEQEGDVLIFEPPHNLHKIWSSPVMRNQENFGFFRQGDFQIQKISQRPNGKFEIVGTIQCSTLNIKDFSAKDAVVVNLDRFGDAFDGKRIVFSVTPAQSEPQTLKILGVSSLTPKQVKTMSQMQKQAILADDLPFYQYKCFHIPCDLYSLGMLLFQTLLETDIPPIASRKSQRGQAIATIAQHVEKLSRDIDTENTTNREQIERRAYALLDNHDKRWRELDPGMRARTRPSWCSRENIFYHPTDENWAIAEWIPQDLWQDALMIAFKLVTNIENFSYCASNSDFEQDDPSSRVMRALSAVDILVSKVHTRLFGLHAIARPVHDALSAVYGREEPTDVEALEQLGIRQSNVTKVVRLFSDKISEDAANRSAGDLRKLLEKRFLRTKEVLTDELSQRAFAYRIRAAFPYVAQEAKAENFRLQRKHEHLQGQVLKLVGAAGVDELSKRRLDELDSLVAVCNTLRDHIESAPTDLNSMRNAAGITGAQRSVSTAQQQPILDLMKKWATGMEEIDLPAEVQSILDERKVINVRLLGAHNAAVKAGLRLVFEQIDREFDRAMEGRNPIISKAKLKDLRSQISEILTNDDLHRSPQERYFWDAFADAYRSSERR
ncbi:MAG: hypothetical protein V3W41_00085 [Planctomycetota bacterium]